jgi:peroxiredoxin
VLSAAGGDIWLLGDPADDRQARIESLEAPDFTLPDVEGNLHSLSDYRGQKVFLTTWASWCGCRRDLSTWQRLTDELGGEKLKVIAVALDSEPGAPDPWIAEAKPSYPALIDREHHVAELYDLVNVPQAVWINEEGRIVRPPEPAGAFDFLNKRKPGEAGMSPELAEASKETRLRYLDALKDWAENGAASQYAYSEDEARARINPPDASVLEAHANFRLGQHLLARGRRDEAQPFIDRARELHPESWAMFRQAAEKLTEGPLAGIAAAADFQSRLAARAEAGKPYYAPIDIDGIPS